MSYSILSFDKMESIEYSFHSIIKLPVQIRTKNVCWFIDVSQKHNTKATLTFNNRTHHPADVYAELTMIIARKLEGRAKE